MISTNENFWGSEKLATVLKEEGIVVMPTDTLYGILGSAQSIFVVNNVYTLRKRTPTKPCIILIGGIEELEKFSVILSETQKDALKKYWDISNEISVSKFEPTSIIFDCGDENLEYLHRGTKTLAFRMPNSKSLRDLLLKTGPLIAPSANVEGLPPAENILEAKKYFGDAVDLYIDGGTITGKASRVIKLNTDGSIDVLR